MSSRWDRHWFRPVESARPHVLLRAVLLLLGLDAWMLMPAHGGRYGLDGFNVAHAAWLDTLVGVPSPSLYVGVVLLAGLLAVALAVTGRVHRPTLALLAVLYTFAWAMSELDSYQHHYLLSLVLVAFVGWPGYDPERARAPAWPYVLACHGVAIVYAFTALSKLEPHWRSGDALGRLVGETIAPMQQASGVAPESFFAALSWGTISLEVLVALGYVVAAYDEHRWARVVRSVALAAAVAFHLGADGLGLEIGWFSAYMIVFAIVVFAPARAVRVVARLAWFRYGDQTARPRSLGAHGVRVGLVALVGAVVAGAVGTRIDLPGALPAAAIFGGVVALVAVTEAWRGRAPGPWLIAGPLAAALMWGAVAFSDVRYDYYRFVGGEAARRGWTRDAIAAYQRAIAYAHTDEQRASRRAKLDTLQRAADGR